MRVPSAVPANTPSAAPDRLRRVLKVMGLVAPARGLRTDQGMRLFTLSGTKDAGELLVLQGPLSRWAWRFFTHRVTRAGRWFAGLTSLLMFVGATSLEIQAYILFLYAAAFWALTFLFVLFARPRVSLAVRCADRVFAGETLQVEADVTSTTRLWTFDVNLLPHRLPLVIDAAEPDGTQVGTLPPGETRRVRVGLVCARRGAYRLKGYRVESDFPFGLMNAYRVFKRDDGLLVYPAYTPLLRLDLPTGRRFQPGGVALAAKVGESFEFLGNREYREGDNIRDIDWRATGRFGGVPVVREWREEYFQRVGLVLDTHVPPRLRARDLAARRDAFERAVSLAAAIGDAMSQQDLLIDVFAAGPNLHHLMAGRSLAYLEQILDILACVEENQVEPISAIEPQIGAIAERLTSVVCVFLAWDEIRQSFVENLLATGVGVKVVVVESEGSADTQTTAPAGDVRFIGPDEFREGVEAI